MAALAITLLLVLALLPGFLFFVGLHIPASETVEEDVASWRRPGHIARLLITATIFHSILIALIVVIVWCFNLILIWPSFSLSHFLFEGWQNIASPVLSPSDLRGAFLAFIVAASYFVVSGIIAGNAGYVVARWNIKTKHDKKLRRKFARMFFTHLWVYELHQHRESNKWIYAYVLTKDLVSGERQIYAGILEDLYCQSDGEMKYVVIRTATKTNLQAQVAELTTSTKSGWRRIGHHSDSVAFFPGSSIDNIVFEWSESHVSKSLFRTGLSPDDIHLLETYSHEVGQKESKGSAE